MKQITLEAFNTLLANAEVKPRLKRELRFVASTTGITDEQWHDLDFLPIYDRSNNKGALILEISSEYYLLPFELKRGLASNLTGRAQPVICDLCKTWQSGTRAGSITFPIPGAQRSISYLCCADLRCSDHVRSKTSAAKTSRSQLREDISPEERIQRLRVRLLKLPKDLNAKAVNV